MPTGVDFSFLSFLRYYCHTSLSQTPARGEVDLRQLLMSVLRLMSKSAYHTFDSCDSISVAGVLLGHPERACNSPAAYVLIHCKDLGLGLNPIATLRHAKLAG